MNPLWDSLDQVITRHADAEAVTCGTRRLSYSQLKAEIEAASAPLGLDKLSPGSVVGIYLPNSVEFLISFWAVVRAGHTALTLNTKYQQGELEHYLTHRPVSLLITEEEHREALQALFAGANLATELVTLDSDDADSLVSPPPVAPCEATTPALMQFSTGSTGRPKGVIRTHENLLEEIEGARRRVRPESTDRILGLVPLYHAHGFANAMCTALFSGASLVLARDFDPRGSLELLQNERISIFPAVPFMVKLLAVMRTAEEPDLSPLRICYTAGAVLPKEDAARFEKRFGVKVHQLYGSTETGAVALSYEPEERASTAQTVGRPLSHVTITLFDDDGQPVAPGEEGEIGISTQAAVTCYDDNPSATASSFREGHFFPGDLGRFDAQGCLAITGRRSLFINAGGNKVDPVEVEQVLLAHPQVQEAVALGIPTSSGGETIKVVLVAESGLTREAVLDHCRGQLATFKLPKMVEFRDEIPKSPLGKVLRKYLV